MSRFDRVHFLLPLVTLFCIVSHIWPNIGRKSRQLYNPTCIHRPRRNFAKMFSIGKTGMIGLHMLKEVSSCVKPFRHNTRTLRTENEQTEFQ